jgi:putative flippase GtrA
LPAALDALRSRFEVATREFAKFGIIGAVNMALDIALWNLLVKFAMPDAEVKAKIIATLVATTSSYFMNRHWTFRHRSRAALHREYLLFFLFNAVALAIQTAVVAGAKYGLGVESILWLNIVNLGGIGIGTVFRFWSYRRFVWLLPTPEEPTPEESEATPPPQRITPLQAAEAPSNAL